MIHMETKLKRLILNRIITKVEEEVETTILSVLKTLTVLLQMNNY